MPGKTWPLTLLGLCLTACAQERVSVGGLDRVVDLAKCAGTGTVCEMHNALWFPPWRTIEAPPEPEVCVPSEGEPWHIAWRQPLNYLPCAPLGDCSTRMVKVAGDGSVWIAGLGTKLLERSAGWQAGVSLTHLDRDGRPIAQRVVETRQLEGEFSSDVASSSAQHALGIATDARGHVFVALAWNERPDGANETRTTASISEYDEFARQVGEPVELRGVSASMQLGLTSGASLVLLAVENGLSPGGGLGRSRMAAFDSALKPIWVQALASPGALPTAMLANGDQLALATPGERSAPALPDWYMLDNYDAHGNAVASLGASPPILPLSIDPDGDVLLLDTPADVALKVRKIGPEGNTLWSVKVPRLDDPGTTTDSPPATAVDSTGKSYFLRAEKSEPETPLISRLVELDASGRECVTSPVYEDDDVDPMSSLRMDRSVAALFVTDSDEVYFQSQKLIARLKRQRLR